MPAVALVHGGGQKREQHGRGVGLAARCLAPAGRSSRWRTDRGVLPDANVLHGDRTPRTLRRAQFETIHPFLDGNGRIGRLLITCLLCHEKVLQRPVLYLSHYLKQHRASYYDRLMAIRLEGDWEGWLRFFLTGVAEVAREAEQTARQIVRLREDVRQRTQSARMTTTALRLLDYLFQRPVINVDAARDHLGVSFAAANNLISRLCDLGVLSETTGGSRNRVFRFGPYIDLFSEVVEEAAEVAEPRPTQFDAVAD